MFRVSCIQLRSNNNIHQNLKRTEKFIVRAVKQKADFILTPEVSSLFSLNKKQLLKKCKPMNKDEYLLGIRQLAKKNMRGLKRILKKGGVITAQVGSFDKKPKQVENWCKVLDKSFGNVKLSGAYIPSFDCKWNFASSIMK